MNLQVRPYITARLQRHLAATIAEFGHAVLPVPDNPLTPRYTYTVGLTETYGHPELLVFALDHAMAIRMLNALVARIRGGRAIDTREQVDGVANFPLAFRMATPDMARKYAPECFRRYQEWTRSPAVMQVVVCDAVGKLPWDAGYINGMREIQPHLWPHLH